MFEFTYEYPRQQIVFEIQEHIITLLERIHPDVVKLLNAFKVVFFMDTACKTNKYWLSLLEIVGLTSIGLTFSATFAFLSSEICFLSLNVKIKLVSLQNFCPI